MRTLAILIFAAGLAHASPLNVNLVDPNQTGIAGMMLTFIGDLENTTASSIAIASDSTNVDSPLVLDDTPFFTNAPPSVDSGASTGHFTMFTILIPGNATLKTYNGFFAVLDDNNQVAGTTAFSVTVQAATTGAPEPATVLLAAPLIVIYWRRRHFERQRTVAK